MHIKYLTPLLFIAVFLNFNCFAQDFDANGLISKKLLEKMVDHTLNLLFSDESSDPSKTEILKTLQKKENIQKLKMAQQMPLPGMLLGDYSYIFLSFLNTPFPQKNNTVTCPPILQGMSMQEAMLLGTIASILEKNDILEAVCRDSLKENTLGKFLEISEGRELHYLPFGNKNNGGPCIIMQSGLGDDAAIWKDLQNLLSDITYGLSYSRAGLGPSGEVFQDQASIERVLEDFHIMLTLLEKKKEISPPYILLGHSLGGTFVQLYAHKYPEKLKGIVLVDSSSEAMIANDMPDEIRLPFKSKLLLPYEEFPPVNLMPVSTSQALFPQAVHETGVLREMQTFQKNMELLKAHTIKVDKGETFLWDLPLRVLSVDEVLEEGNLKLTEEQQAWKKLQKQLTMRSRNSKQIICKPEVGHYIQLDDPQMIVDVIQELINLREPY